MKKLFFAVLALFSLSFVLPAQAEQSQGFNSLDAVAIGGSSNVNDGVPGDERTIKRAGGNTRPTCRNGCMIATAANDVTLWRPNNDGVRFEVGWQRPINEG